MAVPGGAFHILICDDDVDTCVLVEHLLADAQVRVSKVHSGPAAMEQCRRELPDAIVLDIMMPEMSGTEFLTWLRQEYPDTFVPVLFLTALSQNEEKIRGLELGADDYLTKPFHHRELRARVEALMRIKRLTDRVTRMERQIVAGQLAGTVAHKIGQSITTILLQCRMLEKQAGEKSSEAIAAIKGECATVQEILTDLEKIDANVTQGYLFGKEILAIKDKP